jgi:Fic family protein
MKSKAQPIGAWSAVSYEEFDWQPSSSATLSRTQRIRHSGSYEAAIPVSIAPIEDFDLSRDTLALSSEAATAIARFDAQYSGHLSPFAPLLLRSESAASSKIENLTASAKAIALAELGDPSKANANVIVANTRAMEAAVALAQDLDEAALLKMHDVLLRSSHPNWAGKWRQEQVWIGGSDFGPHGAAFVPPNHARIPDAMTDLVSFMMRDDLISLVQIAIAHAQFETIHPFPDGNGRVGRALIHAMLRGHGITQSVTFPISAGLLTNTERYFQALTQYREGDANPIITTIANAAFPAIENGTQLVVELQEIQETWVDRVHVRKGSTAWDVIDHLIRQPVVDSASLQRELASTAPSVNAALDHLEGTGILRKVSGNFRNRKWAATEVLAALDAFAERAGRRR